LPKGIGKRSITFVETTFSFGRQKPEHMAKRNEKALFRRNAAQV
jgi:hypothetical protein